MRCLFLLTAFACSAVGADLDAEVKSPYQLRVVVRSGDHPTLTRHFRNDVAKNVGSALQSALGPLGSVEVIDYNDTPDEKRDPLWKLVDEKGLEALDGVNAGGGGKTHFVFLDFADGKYEIRTRQHDGTSGFCTPIVRKTVHGDRGFVGRLAGLAVAQDFGLVGTFDPTGPQVSVLLKAGALGPVGAWVKEGDVFAVVQLREGRRKLPKGAKGKEAVVTPTTGTRLDGVLLQVVGTPRDGIAVCKLHNRYKGTLPRDAVTLGYRAVKLGTGEAKLRLQLTDAAGTPYRMESVQPRAGDVEYPDSPRDREETLFADGVFTSKQAFKNIAFVAVKSGESVVARLPVEIYPDRVAVRKVSLTAAAETAPAAAAANDMLDRVRNARVLQARAFDEVARLQEKEKQKALDYAQAAFDSFDKEADILRADIDRLKARYKPDAPPQLFDPAEADLRALTASTKELRAHLVKLKDVIRIENDPALAAARKKIEGLLLDAKLAVQKADVDAAIAKYEEALAAAKGSEQGGAAAIAESLAELKKAWELKGPEHEAARKFIYEAWPKLEAPADVKAALPEIRKAVETCKRVGDRITLAKLHATGPEVFQKYADGLRKMLNDAKEDEDRKAVAAYEKTTDELQALLTDVGKEIGAEK